MQPGQLISGEFLLQRLVSQQQTGEVWRALEVKVGRLVLLRFIPEPFRISDASMKRLQQHFVAVQQWKHPHIVPFDRLAEQSENGAFLVSRFVEGPSLNEYAAQWIQAEGRFPFRLIFDVLQPVAAALDEAKAQNSAHRSLSHRMIVVSPTEGIQIQGFELAGIIREELNFPDELETIRYLAPEQLQNRKADSRSDQYSLAMIVAELLANKVLFNADNADELRSKILTTAPPRLPNYRDGVNASLQRALHRDPSVRFPSCMQFLDGLSGSIPADFPPPYIPPTQMTTVQNAQSIMVPSELLDSIYSLATPPTTTPLTNTPPDNSSISSPNTVSTTPAAENQLSVREMIAEKNASFKKILAAAQSANAEKIVSKIRKEQRFRLLFYLGIVLLFISLLIGIYFCHEHLVSLFANCYKMI
ncbi:MAG: protein kinase [Planctomycetaceae bacterium]|jgi:serine/threonine protein kinase|nr:protein kinase [Planctomycetaceae bacterium]